MAHEPVQRIVAQLIPDTDAPELGPLLVAELAKRSDCPSFGAFLEGHPECSECLVRRACEARLAVSILSEAQDLKRLDSIATTANVADLVQTGVTTSSRVAAAVKRAMGKSP